MEMAKDKRRAGRRALALLLLLLLLGSARATEPLLSGDTGPSARVLVVKDPQATDAFTTRPEIIRAMVNRGVTALSGKATVGEAWRGILSTQAVANLAREVVGIKVYSLPGPNSGTRPAVVAAVIEGLLAAGLAPQNIVVWDRQLVYLRLAGFSDLCDRYGVRMAGSAEAGYDTNAFYDNPLLGNLVWGDVEFGRRGEGLGRKSFVSKLLTQEITKIINVTPLLNHNLAGVSGNLYSLAMGSVDNILRFESDADRLATAVPEIYALTVLNDRVVLNITDALVCQYEGGERGLLHYSATLNELRFSKDPVALDALSIKELDTLRQAAGAPAIKPNIELYSNAALLELGVSDLKRIRIDRLR